MKNILEEVRLEYISRRKKLELEIKQSRQEGKNISKDILVEIEKIKFCSDESEAEKRAVEICEEMRKLSVEPDYAYREPEIEEEIIKDFPDEKNVEFNKEELRSKIAGAWMGRTAGCLLGQPVECWMRERILGFLRAENNYPIRTYMSSEVTEEIREKYKVIDEPGAYGNKKISWINNVSCAPEDDDLNYTIMGVGILERYGRNFTSCDVAEYLTLNLPIFMTCTAERIAYKNIVNGILPPLSATYGNPYREWLGAQIRVDAYAYVNPGNGYEAARMAIRDAAVTHTKNGIYGAVFCASLIAESAICNDPDEVIRRALEYIPRFSRLRVALQEFLRFCEHTDEAEKAIQWVHDKYNEADEHDWCHVIPNDMLICLALHYGKQDFTKVIGLAVEAGFDTDCNAATAGSVFGMMYGIEKIPEHWIRPINNKLMTRIECLGQVNYECLVERCMHLIEERYKLN